MCISASPWTFALAIFATLFNGASLISLADNYHYQSASSLATLRDVSQLLDEMPLDQVPTLCVIYSQICAKDP